MAARIEELHEAYNAAKQALRSAIRKEKARTWNEMVFALDEDPWGLLNRLEQDERRDGPGDGNSRPSVHSESRDDSLPTGGGCREYTPSGKPSGVGR